MSWNIVSVCVKIRKFTTYCAQMCNLRLHRIYKSVFINHALCEHVIMDPEHLLLIWKNSFPVLKAAFGMSIAG